MPLIQILTKMLLGNYKKINIVFIQKKTIKTKMRNMKTESVLFYNLYRQESELSNSLFNLF